MTKKRLLAKVLARTGSADPAPAGPGPVAAGYSFFRQGNYQEALKIWENAAPPPAAVAEAFFRLGLQHHAAGRTRAALAAWQKAVRVQPDRALYHFHRGLAYHRLNDLAAGAASFRLALALRPGSPRILFHLGLTVAAMALAGDGQPQLTAWLEREGADLAPPQKDFLKAVAYYAAGKEAPPSGHVSLAATHLVRSLASDPDAAKAHIGEALVLEPENAAAWRLSSLVLAALGDPAADQALERACALGNRRDQLLPRVTELKKGFLNDLARRGDLAGAVAFLSREGKASPVDPGRERTALLLTRRGNDLARREEWEQAAECWRRAREAGARDPRLLHNLALAAELLGRPEAAAGYWRRTIDAWTTAVGQGPDGPRTKGHLATAYRHLAELEAGEGHYEAYVTDLELAARYAAQDVQIRLDLARAYMAGEEEAKCLSVLEAALRLAPENPEVISGLAIIYLKRDEWPKAGPLLTRGLAVAPDDPHLRRCMTDYYMQRAYSESRDYADCVHWMGKALEIAPDRMPVLLCMAVYAYANDRRSDWRQYRDAALSLAPGNPAPYFSLARLLLGQGHPAMGRKYLNKALALTPGDADAYLRAADICLGGKLPRDADRHLRQALNISPAIRIYQEAADLYLDHEQWEPALPILEEARKAFPDDPQILIDLAETLISLERYGEAFQVVTQGEEGLRRTGMDPDAARAFKTLKRFLEEETFD